MKRLKLFEDFEEKSFYKIDTQLFVSSFNSKIPFNNYPFSNLDDLLKKRLAKIFNHNDFYYEKLEYNYILVYERLNSLVAYRILLTEDEWFYIESKNRALGSPPGIFNYYKCDDIKGVSDAIKYDYDNINKNGNLHYTLYYILPSKQSMYGVNGVKGQFFEANSILLDTHQFPISDFPEEEVNKIIPDIYLPNDKEWGPFRHKEFLDLKVDGKMAKLTWNNYTIDLYYIKETNRFNLAYLADWIYYTCLGTEGLKSFLTVFFKKI